MYLGGSKASSQLLTHYKLVTFSGGSGGSPVAGPVSGPCPVHRCPFWFSLIKIEGTGLDGFCSINQGNPSIFLKGRPGDFFCTQTLTSVGAR